jgi:hypothetical protein
MVIRMKVLHARAGSNGIAAHVVRRHAVTNFLEVIETAFSGLGFVSGILLSFEKIS